MEAAARYRRLTPKLARFAAGTCVRGARTQDEAVIESSYATGEDVTAQVTALRNQHVDAILNPTYEGDFDRMLQAMGKLGVHALVGGASDSMTPRVMREHNEVLQNALIFGFADIPQWFSDAIQRREPNNPLTTLEAAALGYLHVKQLARTTELEPFETSPADALLGFKGWKDQKAVFETKLRRFRALALEAVPE